MLDPILSSTFLQSLSLTLLHFLWQGLLVAFVLKSCFFFIGNNKPQVRYVLSTIAMFVNFTLPFITFALISQNGSLTVDALVHASNGADTTILHANQTSGFGLSEFLPYISLLWLATVILLSCKLIIEVFQVNQLPKYGSMNAEPALLARFNELALQLKLNKPPQLLISLKIKVPMAIGWLKPVVLLPASMVSGLSSAQLEMLILHELAHIRRYDYLVNFLQTMVEILLFFHPAVMWVSKQMRHEREYCSDDIAVHHCGNAVAYAHTLADTASMLTKHAKKKAITIPSMAIAASGGDLKQRVIRLVDHHHCSSSHDFSKWLAALTIISAMLIFSSKQFLTHNITYSMFDFWGYNSTWFKSVEPINTTIVNKSKNVIEKGLEKAALAQQLLFENEPVEPTIATVVQQAQRRQQTTASLSSSVERPPAQQVLSTNTQENILLNNQTLNADINIAPVSPHSDLLKPASFSESSIALEKKLTAPVANTYVNKTFIDEELNHQPNLIENTRRIEVNQLTKQNNYTEQAATLSVDARSHNESFFAEPFNAAMHASPTLFVESLAVSYNAENKHTKVNKSNKQWLKAKQLATAEPKYPSSAKRKGIELDARVFFTIDKNGLIKDVQFEHKSKMAYFKNAIRSAIRKWRFIPAQLNGKPVESRMSKIFSFSLKD